MLRFVIIIYNLSYLFYLKEINEFKLVYKFIFINILIAMFQWIFYLKSPSLSYLIGPTNIAKVLYGNYAGPTFTNFFPIFYIHRAAGLSRETGFFCTLLIIATLLHCEEYKDYKKVKFQRLLLVIGLIISMTKMVIILPIIIIIKKYDNYLKKIPVIPGVILLIIFFNKLTEILYSNNFFIAKNETWNHRLGGYKVLTDIFKDNIFTVYSNLSSLAKKFEYLEFLKHIVWLEKFTGIPELIIHNGLGIGVVFILLLKFYNITFDKILILFFLTFGVGFSTTTSFVLLSYLYVLQFKIKEKNEIFNFNS
ncbi:MAG: hypothetical protein ACRC6E_06365 [Fusobacteriaceae bacterium]